MHMTNRLEGFWPEHVEPVTNFSIGSKEWSDDVCRAYNEGVANERALQRSKTARLRTRMAVRRMRRRFALNKADERGFVRGLLVSLAAVLICFALKMIR